MSSTMIRTPVTVFHTGSVIGCSRELLALLLPPAGGQRIRSDPLDAGTRG